MPQLNLKNRIALITGASMGIGAAVAKRFAREGVHVIAIARNRKGLEETDDHIRAEGGMATLIEFDLQDTKKFPALAANIAERFGRLDILVGNAGLLGDLSPMPDISPEDWDKVIAVNLTANYHLIRVMHPLLMISDTPRAMFVTSGIAAGVHPYWGTYAVSKSALETLVKTYAGENVKTKLKANLINPGGVATRMYTKAFPGADTSAMAQPSDVTDVFVKLADSGFSETGKIFHAQK